MGVADHAAIDAARLTDKNIHAPGSAVLTTSIIADNNFNDWLKTWLEIRFRGIEKRDCLVIGLSCSTNGSSSDCIVTALNWAAEQGVSCAMFAASPKETNIHDNVIQIVQYVKYYHTSELLSLACTYELINSSGFKCPTISGKARKRRFETLGIDCETEISEQEAPPGMENQLMNICIDFDGVIHNFDKGWYDGTCYGKPLAGALDAIKMLSKSWNIIIYSAKVRHDRPLVDGMTGYELVQEWLEKYNVLKYVDGITHEKPRAQYYIDDKAIRFTTWKNVLEKIK
jgi:hypothetical protein